MRHYDRFGADIRLGPSPNVPSDIPPIAPGREPPDIIIVPPEPPLPDLPEEFPPHVPPPRPPDRAPPEPQRLA